MEITVTLTDEEVKALETDMLSIQAWVSNAIHNKARQCIDRIITKSGKGSKFTSVAEKTKIIQDLVKENSELLKTAVDKNQELESKSS